MTTSGTKLCPLWAESERPSALARMSPGLVPVLARGIDDAAVGLEELVGDLEDREHQPALRTPCDVAAALFAPDEFTRLRCPRPGPACRPGWPRERRSARC